MRRRLNWWHGLDDGSAYCNLGSRIDDGGTRDVRAAGWTVPRLCTKYPRLVVLNGSPRLQYLHESSHLLASVGGRTAAGHSRCASMRPIFSATPGGRFRPADPPAFV